MIKKILLILVICFLVGCSNSEDDNINEYKNDIDDLANNADFVETSEEFNIEVVIDVANNDFIVIVDGNETSLESFKVISFVVSDSKVISKVPQIGYFDEVTLGVGNKGVILTGQITGDILDDVIVLTRVSYFKDEKLVTEYLKTKEMKRIE